MQIIPKKLLADPIKLPENSFWSAFKRFGRDEIIAMVVNIIGTAIATVLTSNPLLLSVAGPILEKIGFFPAHFKEALHVYRTTPLFMRESLWTYMGRAIKGGSVSLAEDVIVHDPIYIGLIYLGISVYPSCPPWILAAISFAVAVIAVAGLEVAYTETCFRLFKRKLRKAGFGSEKYFEARFYINVQQDIEKMWWQLIAKLNLKEKGKLNYNDVYFNADIKHYSGRTPKIRLRQRTSDFGEDFVQTAQVIFTKAYEADGDLDQCRYFPSKKEKLYLHLLGEMPKRIEEIRDYGRDLLSKLVADNQPTKTISFTRKFAVSSKDLLISIDEITVDQPFYVLEVKTYKNITLFLQAMRLVMQGFPVVQTTYGKSEIF